MRLNARHSVYGVVFAAMVLVTQADAITIETVSIGNPGNAADTRYINPDHAHYADGKGSIAYNFRIAKTEVTNSQFAEFLNAVAVTDRFQLFDPRSAIEQIGTDGSYSYRVKSPKPGEGPDGTAYSYENKPVQFVTYYDALRFANWLHNGQPIGAQGPETTEEGAYLLAGGFVIPTSVFGRRTAARWWIPNENEWYKSAYYDPANFDYPCRSNSMPDNNIPSLDSGNSANYFDGEYTTANFNYPLTDVDAYGRSISAYGTLDQGGNVSEWTETRSSLQPSSQIIRGGSWINNQQLLRAQYSQMSDAKLGGSVGFRVACSPATVGDFNEDGLTDSADFVVWRKNNGTTSDYSAWRANFLKNVDSNGAGVTTSVPEPSSIPLVVGAVAFLWGRTRGTLCIVPACAAKRRARWALELNTFGVKDGDSKR